jgi:ribosome modulation factor
MTFSKKARSAQRLARKGKRADGYVETLREGEKAFLAGHGQDANPYQSATEESEIWAEGWEDARDVYGKPAVKPLAAEPAGCDESKLQAFRVAFLAGEQEAADSERTFPISPLSETAEGVCRIIRTKGISAMSLEGDGFAHAARVLCVRNTYEGWQAYLRSDAPPAEPEPARVALPAAAPSVGRTALLTTRCIMSVRPSPAECVRIVALAALTAPSMRDESKATRMWLGQMRAAFRRAMAARAAIEAAIQPTPWLDLLGSHAITSAAVFGVVAAIVTYLAAR